MTDDTQKHSTPEHRSVLLHEVIRELNPRPDSVVIDATLGGAGHAHALAERLDERGVFLGLDADKEAVIRAGEYLRGMRAAVHLVEGNFRKLAEISGNLGITAADCILFDLGWSAYQLAGGRGFSFKSDEPLFMTYGDPSDPGVLTAREIVGEWKEESIADVLWGWGDEHHARRIARAIVEQREQKPIETARELADIVYAAVPGWYRRRRIHPATKTFQALRIAVNDEFGALKEGLFVAKELLAQNGRVAVITFHSAEDRFVKRLFRSWQEAGSFETIKKPITPSTEEISENPRARSAKMRICIRV
jgi:16S rRNA (cytosine1402-N4)-methyltransferase